MPIYRYHCHACNQDVEVIHSMDDLGIPQIHSCGNPMARKPSLFSFSFPEDNRARIMKALNGEVPLPATSQDRPRIEKALARGMDRNRPIIGKGF